ncbi:MAG: phage tail protein [Chloroflexi bacterium]|nr:MAG: phage tail protein [Chloroflexota bacterium]RLC96320.1 MAG: phage tail protein [Chloroflexota bacterium]
MANPGEVVDYLQNYRFTVEIEGMSHAQFTECSGLDVEREVFSYEEGGLNDQIHKLPGRVKYSNVTLKRGYAAGSDLWDWFQSIIEGEQKRKNVSIVLHYYDGSEAWRWNLVRAYPVKWVGPAFKVDDNGVSIETLELTHEGMTLEKQ